MNLFLAKSGCKGIRWEVAKSEELFAVPQTIVSR